jgi:tRNA threonylcarbamoyladenosine biosynthesis protein TsaB
MELSIDTASDLASVALSREGAVVDEIAWRCVRNHTVELLPAVDRLLARATVQKAELTAVFVTTGPGMYTGLRVGIATAKGLARALDLPLVGVGRLELDAFPHAAFPGTIVAVHRAGRGDLAWASYAGTRGARSQRRGYQSRTHSPDWRTPRRWSWGSDEVPVHTGSRPGRRIRCDR